MIYRLPVCCFLRNDHARHLFCALQKGYVGLVNSNLITGLVLMRVLQAVITRLYVIIDGHMMALSFLDYRQKNNVIQQCSPDIHIPLHG